MRIGGSGIEEVTGDGPLPRILISCWQARGVTDGSDGGYGRDHSVLASSGYSLWELANVCGKGDVNAPGQSRKKVF